MLVHHLNCGTLCVAARRHAFIAEAAPMRGTVVCHCLLIESRAGLVLVETGFGHGDIADANRRLGRPFLLTSRPLLDPQQTALSQIRRLGFSERDVRHIVLTHGHLDHAGGVSDFPWAKVHLYAPEHRVLTSRLSLPERLSYKQLQFAHKPDWAPHELSGDRFMGFDAVRPLPELGDDVLLVPLPGHTQGHAAVAVRSNRGWLMHAGDAYHHRSQLNGAGPLTFELLRILVDWKRDLRTSNLARLAQLKRDKAGEVSVFCAHDPVEYQALRAAASSSRVITSQPSAVT